MNVSKEYQETLDYLYSFVDYSLTRQDRYSPEQFDLGRMYEFVQTLGNPHKQYPIIHVAGTKGKGSTAAFCASALKAEGYQVGLYTSPHLQDYAERIQINGKPVSPEALVALVDELRPLLDERAITTFEITTALAFLYFARSGVDAAVFEVGLGGRLDATNVSEPVTSVITSISYDHTQFLGATLSQIAAEKAGIIKTGVPVAISPQEDEARMALEQIAKERGAPFVLVGQDLLFTRLDASLDAGQTMLVWEPDEQQYVDAYLLHEKLAEWEPKKFQIPLLGYHQVVNAATAYAALRLANENGLPVRTESIREGFARTDWPARFDVLHRDPPLVVDSAHNRDSALKLRLAMDEFFPGREVLLIFGASEDKDISGMFTELLPRVNKVFATKSYHPRAMDPDEIVDFVHRFGKPARAFLEVGDALDAAMLEAKQGGGMVLATGSLFVAAGVREEWNNRLTEDMERYEGSE